MEEDTRKLLQECCSGCKMAINSMEQVKEYIKDEGLKKLVDAYTKEHQELEQECAKCLAKYEDEEKKPGAAVTAFSWLGTEMKLMLNNDSSQVAKIMMDGCNMGIQSVWRYENQYQNASKESKEFAARIVKAEENFMRQLKPYF